MKNFNFSVNGKSWTILVTLLILVCGFTYYFLVYAKNNEGKINERCFRELDNVAENFKAKAEIYFKVVNFNGHKNNIRTKDTIIIFGKTALVPNDSILTKDLSIVKKYNKIKKLKKIENGINEQQKTLEALLSTKDFDSYATDLQKLKNQLDSKTKRKNILADIQKTIFDLQSLEEKEDNRNYAEIKKRTINLEQSLKEAQTIIGNKSMNSFIDEFNDEIEQKRNDVKNIFASNNFFKRLGLQETPHNLNDKEIEISKENIFFFSEEKNKSYSVSLENFSSSIFKNKIFEDYIIIADTSIYCSRFSNICNSIDSAETSHFLHQFAGQEYHVFKAKTKIENGPDVKIYGLLSSKKYENRQHKINSWLLFIIIIIAIIFVLTFPIIKIITLSSIEEITRKDALLAVLSLVMGVSFLFLLLLSVYSFFGIGNKTAKDNLKTVSNKINNKFIEEYDMFKLSIENIVNQNISDSIKTFNTDKFSFTIDDSVLFSPKKFLYNNILYLYNGNEIIYNNPFNKNVIINLDTVFKKLKPDSLLIISLIDSTLKQGFFKNDSSLQSILIKKHLSGKNKRVPLLTINDSIYYYQNTKSKTINTSQFRKLLEKSNCAIEVNKELLLLNITIKNKKINGSPILISKLTKGNMYLDTYIKDIIEKANDIPYSITSRYSPLIKKTHFFITKKNHYRENAIVLSSTFNSITKPVLPHGMKFCIMDKTGEVVYHSENDFNQENFIEECDDTKAIKSTIATNVANHFTSNYHLYKHQGYIQPIKETSLFLVTLYNSEINNTFNSQVFSASFIIVLCIISLFLIQLAILGYFNVLRKRAYRQFDKNEWIRFSDNKKKNTYYSIFIQNICVIVLYFLLNAIVYLINLEDKLIFVFISTLITPLITFSFNYYFLSKKYLIKKWRFTYELGFIIITISAILLYILFSVTTEIWTNSFKPVYICIIFYPFLICLPYYFIKRPNLIQDKPKKFNNVNKKIYSIEQKSTKQYYRLILSWIVIIAVFPSISAFIIAYDTESLILNKKELHEIVNKINEKKHEFDIYKNTSQNNPIINTGNYTNIKKDTISRKGASTDAISSIAKKYKEYCPQFGDSITSFNREYLETAIAYNSGILFHENDTIYYSTNNTIYPKKRDTLFNNISYNFLPFATIIILLVFFVYYTIEFLARKIYGIGVQIEDINTNNIENIPSLKEFENDKEKNKFYYIVGLSGSQKRKLAEKIEEDLKATIDFKLINIPNIDLWKSLKTNKNSNKKIIVIENFEYDLNNNDNWDKKLDILRRLYRNEIYNVFITSQIHPEQIYSIYKENLANQAKDKEQQNDSTQQSLQFCQEMQQLLDRYRIYHADLTNNKIDELFGVKKSELGKDYDSFRKKIEKILSEYNIQRNDKDEKIKELFEDKDIYSSFIQFSFELQFNDYSSINIAHNIINNFLDISDENISKEYFKTNKSFTLLFKLLKNISNTTDFTILQNTESFEIKTRNGKTIFNFHTKNKDDIQFEVDRDIDNNLEKYLTINLDKNNYTESEQASFPHFIFRIKSLKAKYENDETEHLLNINEKRSNKEDNQTELYNLRIEFVNNNTATKQLKTFRLCHPNEIITKSIDTKVDIQNNFERRHNYYYSIWRTIPQEERYILFDLAKDDFVNCKNEKGILSLMKKGLLVNTGTITFINEDFKMFIRSVLDPKEELKRQNKIKKEGQWNKYRAVLILVILALIAVIWISNKDIIGDFTTILTSGSAIIAGILGFSRFFMSD